MRADRSLSWGSRTHCQSFATAAGVSRHVRGLECQRRDLTRRGVRRSRSLGTAEPCVLAPGARKLDSENVYADPAGHPFCLIARPGLGSTYPRGKLSNQAHSQGYYSSSCNGVISPRQHTHREARQHIGQPCEQPDTRAVGRAELVLTSGRPAGHLPAETARTSTSFTIFEATSEIQRMIIGRAVTGLDVR